MANKLPSWLTIDKSGTYVVDVDAAYPSVIKLLGLPVDQYSLECTYQMLKMKVQEIASQSGDDPRDDGKALSISFVCKDKEKWRHANQPAGKGAAAATRGLEAKGHFERLRHKIV